MRPGVAAIIELSQNRLLKTMKPPIHGNVRGIPLHIAKEKVIVGAWVATPGFIKDQVNQLKTDANTLRDYIVGLLNDRSKSSKLSASERGVLDIYFKSSLLPFMTGLSEFIDSHQHWSDNMWGSALDTVNEWREALKAQWSSANKIVSMEGVPEPKGSIDFGITDKLATIAKSGIKDVWSVVKIIIYAGLAILGIVFLARFVEIIKAPRAVPG